MGDVNTISTIFISGSESCYHVPKQCCLVTVNAVNRDKATRLNKSRVPTQIVHVWADICQYLPQYVLKPTFTKQHIAGLDKQGKLYRAYDGTTYLPGIVGLNNIKANDYANVVLQVWLTVEYHFFNLALNIGNELI